MVVGAPAYVAPAPVYPPPYVAPAPVYPAYPYPAPVYVAPYAYWGEHAYWAPGHYVGHAFVVSGAAPAAAVRTVRAGHARPSYAPIEPSPTHRALGSQHAFL